MKTTLPPPAPRHIPHRFVRCQNNHCDGVRQRLSVALCGVLGMAGLLAANAPAAEPVSLRSLLQEMHDLGGMAEFPTPPYTCRQFSSYDRASKSPTEAWFANHDRGMYLRVEDRDGRREYVMMDAPGPGALVRIWSANPEGTLRIYLDGAAEPALEAPMQEVLGGRYPGIPQPIAGERSRGWNLYLPIPYARRCVVTSDAGDFYYHVNYRTYPAHTSVLSFDTAQLNALRGELTALAQRLSQPGQLNPVPPNATKHSISARLKPGQSAMLSSLRGPQAIRRFEIQWAPTGDRDEPLLRTLVLTMTFDGRRTVEAPLGDFFGAGPGLNPYDSVPFSVGADGRMISRWIMPFRESAEIAVRNLGRESATVSGEVSASPYAWTENSLHFHAKWRIDHDLPTDPKIDWSYLSARGRGVFAGAAFAIDNPVKAWWGEGDEKIYVDGESFPSHFGTGTEDYYGYAWCCPDPFVHGYHNQPRCDGPANYGRTSVNRFHVLDRIPFTREFRFDMELWHWANVRVNAAVTSYWYARPDAEDSFRPPTANDVRLRPMPAYQAPRVKGALEGEQMRVLAHSGVAGPQDWNGTSGEQHLWWHGDQQPGDRLILGFDVPRADDYRVFARFLKAVDYGIAEFSVNDRRVEQPIDFYHDGVVVTDEILLGTFPLRSGENRLTVTVVGAHPKAVKRYMIGLDYLRLEPAAP